MIDEDIKITKEDLVLWLYRPPSNDDLDLCSYLSNAVENQYKYYEENQSLKDRIEKTVEFIDKEINSMPNNGCLMRLKEIKKKIEGEYE